MCRRTGFGSWSMNSKSSFSSKKSRGFRDATIGQLAAVERPAPPHLYWHDLDVDLSLDMIDARMSTHA